MYGDTIILQEVATHKLVALSAIELKNDLDIDIIQEKLSKLLNVDSKIEFKEYMFFLNLIVENDQSTFVKGFIKFFSSKSKFEKYKKELKLILLKYEKSYQLKINSDYDMKSYYDIEYRIRKETISVFLDSQFNLDYNIARVKNVFNNLVNVLSIF